MNWDRAYPGPGQRQRLKMSPLQAPRGPLNFAVKAEPPPPPLASCHWISVLHFPSRISPGRGERALGPLETPWPRRGGKRLPPRGARQEGNEEVPGLLLLLPAPGCASHQGSSSASPMSAAGHAAVARGEGGARPGEVLSAGPAPARLPPAGVGVRGGAAVCQAGRGGGGRAELRSRGETFSLGGDRRAAKRWSRLPSRAVGFPTLEAFKLPGCCRWGWACVGQMPSRPDPPLL